MLPFCSNADLIALIAPATSLEVVCVVRLTGKPKSSGFEEGKRQTAATALAESCGSAWLCDAFEFAIEPGESLAARDFNASGSA